MKKNVSLFYTLISFFFGISFYESTLVAAHAAATKPPRAEYFEELTPAQKHEMFNRWVRDLASSETYPELCKELQGTGRLIGTILDTFYQEHPLTLSGIKYLSHFPIDSEGGLVSRHIDISLDGQSIVSTSNPILRALYDPRTGVVNGPHPLDVIKIYNSKSGKLKIIIPYPHGRHRYADAQTFGDVCFGTTDGIVYAINEADRSINALPLNPAAGSDATTIYSADRPISRLQLGRDGKHLLIIDAKYKAAILTDLETKPNMILALPKEHEYLSCGDINVKRKICACTTEHRDAIEIWDFKGKLLQNIKSALQNIRQIRFSMDGSKVILIGSGFATVWEIDTGKKLFDIHKETELNSATFNHNDSCIIAAGVFGLHFINGHTGEPIARPPHFDLKDIIHIATGHDDGLGYRYIIALEYNGMVHVFQEKNLINYGPQILLEGVFAYHCSLGGKLEDHLIPLYESLSEETRTLLHKRYGIGKVGGGCIVS